MNEKPTTNTDRPRNFMLDLESMGTGPRSAIAAIGVVEFDPCGDGVERTLYHRVDLSSSVAAGMVIDAGTVLWWMKQAEEARAEIFNENATPLHVALFDLRVFLGGLSLTESTDDAIVWANGASFDFPILAEAYRAIGVEKPWKYYNERCWRTLRKHYPSVTMTRTGTFHNALDDAIHQARHMQLAMKQMALETQVSE